MFRGFALVAVGLVFGFLLGGVGPRRELGDLSAELSTLKRKLDRDDRPNPLRALLPQLARERADDSRSQNTGSVPSVEGASSATGDDEDKRDPARAESDHRAVIIRGSENTSGGTNTVRNDDSEGAEENSAATGAADTARSDGDRTSRPRGFGELNLARFDELSSAQALRFAASRAALIEQAGLNDKETAAVDQTVKKMNDDLSGYGEEILSQATAEEPPSASQTLGLGHDVSGIMYEGQKQLESIVGERAEGVEPKALEIWNYVDMKRLRPAAEKYLPAGGKPSATGGTGTGTSTTGGTPGTPSGKGAE